VRPQTAIAKHRVSQCLPAYDAMVAAARLLRRRDVRERSCWLPGCNAAGVGAWRRAVGRTVEPNAGPKSTTNAPT
jgi:hypothetical protein